MLNPDEQVNLLLRLTDLCRIGEHRPGRITLKVGLLELPRLTSLINEVKNIEGEIARIPGYRSHKTRVGLTGGSVVIDYDPKVFPRDLWESLGALKKNPSSREYVAQRLRALFDGNGSRC
jgi:hypothetical protein